MKYRSLTRVSTRLWLPIALLVVLCCLPACGDEGAQKQEHAVRKYSADITRKFLFFNDTGEQYGFEEIRSDSFGKRFRTGSWNLSGGEGVLWLKADLRDICPSFPGGTCDSILELGKNFTDYIDFYLPRPDGKWRVIRAGNMRPFNTAMQTHRLPSLQLPANMPEDGALFIRLKSRFSPGMAVKLYSERDFSSHRAEDSYLYGILFGIILGLSLFNLFVYISLHDRVYLYYVIYLITLALYQFILNGQAHLTGLFSPEAGMVLMGVFVSCALFFGVLFTKVFLLTAKYLPFWDRVLSVVMVIAVLRVLPSLLGYHKLGNHMSQAVGLLSPFVSIITGILCWRKGFSPAKYYLLAWSVLTIGVLWHVFVSLGVIPWGSSTSMIMGIGSAVEAVLLSFALADRIRVLQKERERYERDYTHYRRLSTTDSLTGLFNSRYFWEFHRRSVKDSQNHDIPLSLIMMDIDDFKRYNDVFGHPEGDKVLARLGVIIRESLREGDVPCRYGGEEFAVILPGTRLSQAMAVSERIRSRMEDEEFNPSERNVVQVTISIGVAQFRKGDNPETLLKRADGLLYKAKGRGKNRVVGVEG